MLTDFLIGRLENVGIKHVFGVCGEFIINFLGKLSESKKIQLISTVDEEGAAFAADGYARVSGIGCVAVTYNVGALKICNPIAGAYAERSSVIVITGSPGHSAEWQRAAFKNITCAQAILDNPSTAGFEIDRAFEALKHHRQPIYIELPRDTETKPVVYDVYTQGTPKRLESDLSNLEDALSEVTNWINEAKNPVILAGVEVQRFGLGRELVKFSEKYNVPIACTLLSKSAINENYSLYLGVYTGSSSKHHIREIVEGSDCLLAIGEVITEATIGYRPNKDFQKRQMITCTIDAIKVRNHTYSNVIFTDFCKALFKLELKKRDSINLPIKEEIVPFVGEESKLTTARLFEKINSIIDENMIVLADVGDSLFGASELIADTFLGSACYLSMGWAIPAGLGAMLGKPSKRPIIIVGDGAFQMSFNEISTMIRNNLNPIIFVLNNKGYATERLLLDGKFNNVLDWNYHSVGSLMGSGEGSKVQTETELDKAIAIALKCNKVYIINCLVDFKDYSPTLRRFHHV